VLSLLALCDIAAEGVMVAVCSRAEPEANFVLGAAACGEVRRSGRLLLGGLATPDECIVNRFRRWSRAPRVAAGT
jgi:hypothetical protein